MDRTPLILKAARSAVLTYVLFCPLSKFSSVIQGYTKGVATKRVLFPQLLPSLHLAQNYS